MSDLYDDVVPATTSADCIKRAARALARAEERGRLRVKPDAELAIARAYMQLAKIFKDSEDG